jgi:hypothetical protein
MPIYKRSVIRQIFACSVRKSECWDNNFTYIRDTPTILSTKCLELINRLSLASVNTLYKHGGPTQPHQHHSCPVLSGGSRWGQADLEAQLSGHWRQPLKRSSEVSITPFSEPITDGVISTVRSGVTRKVWLRFRRSTDRQWAWFCKFLTSRF